MYIYIYIITSIIIIIVIIVMFIIIIILIIVSPQFLSHVENRNINLQDPTCLCQSVRGSYAHLAGTP